MMDKKEMIASKIILQNTFISMWIYIGIMTLVFLVMSFLVDSRTNIPMLSASLDINVWYLLIQGILIVGLGGSMNYLFHFGFTRVKIFITYIITGLLVSFVSVFIIAIISLIINVMPVLNNLSIDLDISVLWIIVTRYLYGLLFFYAGVLITIGFYKGLWPGFLAMFVGVLSVFIKSVVIDHEWNAAWHVIFAIGMSGVIIVLLWYMMRHIEIKLGL